MAKKISIDSFRQPSLFDAFDLVPPANQPQMPVHPDIERLARKTANAVRPGSNTARTK